MNRASTSPFPGSGRRFLWVIFFCLLGLLALSAMASRVITGPAGMVFALAVAAAKAALIFVYFMRLRYQSGLVRLFAVAGFFWLGLIVLFTFADYLTRG